ncbi:hypothetical protein B5X24_HaOG204141 [Helicoverpa armigera]|uniref:Uncharacterized protein n=1 Tax=Helicoverpa armigera TaxID=29058 RepID=A0A2W1BYB1_HELAM|nr:hypothetical protein B5X24_HaOG204141 [Helicoverpa armigera]
MQDVLEEDSEMTDWLIERDSKSGVVLHDRLMTDAALGAAPIKTEHSYSLHSDVESAPSSPHHTKVDGLAMAHKRHYGYAWLVMVRSSRKVAPLTVFRIAR